MKLALVKLSRFNRKNNRVYYFLDYISYDVAKLGVQIQGSEHAQGEWSFAKIVRVIDSNQ